MTFNEAAEYAKTVNSQKACGHDDWRVPTKNELAVLFNNRAAIGGFDIFAEPDGWYLSSPGRGASAIWGQSFHNGRQSSCINSSSASVRLVRCGAPTVI
jgi:hypothetical protein